MQKSSFSHMHIEYYFKKTETEFFYYGTYQIVS
jgi:hypothetical protein